MERHQPPFEAGAPGSSNDSSATSAANAAAASAERFSDGVANLLMAVEELRGSLNSVISAGKKVETGHVVRWLEELEGGVLRTLGTLERWTDDAVAELETDLFRHCFVKAVDVAQKTLDTAYGLTEPDDDDPDLPPDVTVDALRKDGQGAVARLVEVNLLLLENARGRGIDLTGSGGTTQQREAIDDAQEIVESYVAYQRRTLRQRAKPTIAQLVQARRDGGISNAPLVSSLPVVVTHHHADNDDEDDVNGADDNHQHQHNTNVPAFQQYHGPVVGTVLGQAAALIYPLLEWRASLPPLPEGVEDDPAALSSYGVPGLIQLMCTRSVETLDEQAQTLVKTVSDWFWDDRPMVEEWMRRSAETADVRGLERHELGVLDGLVEEMALVCNLQARYHALVKNSGVKIQTTTLENELLPEWTWKYAALERFLAVQQWHSALELASPMHIVIGSDITVPSVVEDAQYLSTRALERAANTQSTQAIGTVAHAVSHDVWSTEIEGSVHHALLQRYGCWQEQAPDPKKEPDSPPKSSGFASALLDAFDEDLGPSAAAMTTPSGSNQKKPQSAPSSGNFLANLVGAGGGDKLGQMHLDTEFCAMNGIHAACLACRSLVSFLDSLMASPDEGNLDGEAAAPPTSGGSQQDEKATALIQLAREELFRYAESYQNMLTGHIQESLEASCGSMAETVALRGLCFHDLYAFLEHENYNLNSNEMALAESDERLDRELIEPLRSSRFLGQLSSKCEADVLRQIGEAIVTVVVNIFLEVLWKTGKKVSDWGSLLLAKQVRLVQGFVSKILSPTDATEAITPISLFEKWERLSHVFTVLQLEKPSDWLAYTNSSLSPEELNATLCLRVEFSPDAIQAVVAQVSKNAEPGKDSKA